MKNSIQMIISATQIRKRIIELGQQITSNYKNSQQNMVLVGLLKGSFIFIADLCRCINIEHEIDFMTISSYGNNTVTNMNVKILKDLNQDVCGKNVLIIEDIIDSGNTWFKVREIIKSKKPHSLAICTLLNKTKSRDISIHIDYTGFYISNDFVVGYGIDYAQYYRSLPYIAKVIF
ncbi:hypoxanthine phosphoribosyltransferase [Buchnera aphidicola (Mollitrichosiphum nigrofasciatum)]|uniref:hypoxanthine phosphoribosyltransferase n=1 Tax=Buchnera aphidicola TaxID=9 RepID=UPI0031B86758